MPCRDWPDENVRYVTEDSRATLNKVDKLTRMLCGLCTRLEIVGQPNRIDEVSELRKWWTAHKEADQKREAQEKAKREAERKRDLAEAERLRRKWNG